MGSNRFIQHSDKRFSTETNLKDIEFDLPVHKEIKQYIIFNLRHGATLLQGQGAFSEEDKAVIVCLVSYREIAEFLRIMKKFPDTFVYYSDVMGVYGNFAFDANDETEEDKLLLKNKQAELENLQKT